MTRFLLSIAAIAAVTLALGCGKEKDDGPPEKKQLDPTAHCTEFFEEHNAGGDKDAFLAACKKDMSLLACAGPAAGSGFCARAGEDAAKEAIIDEMKVALGK